MANYTDIAFTFLKNSAAAIAVLLVGLYVIGMIVKRFGKILEKRNTDASAVPFMKSLLKVTLQCALVISVMGMIGIKTTSFLAVLGTLGLAIGMALKGSLSNIAGGVMILLFRPFKSGDFVEALG